MVCAQQYDLRFNLEVDEWRHPTRLPIRAMSLAARSVRIECKQKEETAFCLREGLNLNILFFF